LAVIGISFWSQNIIEGFFNIGRYGKPPLNMALPPGEYNRKKLTALTGVCARGTSFLFGLVIAE